MRRSKKRDCYWMLCRREHAPRWRWHRAGKRGLWKDDDYNALMTHSNSSSTIIISLYPLRYHNMQHCVAKQCQQNASKKSRPGPRFCVSGIYMARVDASPPCGIPLESRTRVLLWWPSLLGSLSLSLFFFSALQKNL